LEALPVGECPDDVQLIGQVVETDFSEIPIVILEQKTHTVKFLVRNFFFPNNSKAARIYTKWEEGQHRNVECSEDANVERGEYSEYTAHCMANVPITTVSIWVSDASFLDGFDNAQVPQCCHPPEEYTFAKVQYSFKI
jgi:hypothetical protein